MLSRLETTESGVLVDSHIALVNSRQGFANIFMESGSNCCNAVPANLCPAEGLICKTQLLSECHKLGAGIIGRTASVESCGLHSWISFKADYATAALAWHCDRHTCKIYKLENAHDSLICRAEWEVNFVAIS